MKRTVQPCDLLHRKEAIEIADSGVLVTLAGALITVFAAGSISQLAALPFSDAGFLSAVLYQGFGCSILAFFLSNAAIAKIGVNRTASFIGVSTVVSVVAGVVLLHESFTAFRIV